jgi:hypothetical protein
MACRSYGLLALLALAGCGGQDSPDEAPQPLATPPRPTVFDPLTSTLERAQGVQETVDEQAAELRRRLEEAER